VIGVIGPSDSVARAEIVAVEEGIREAVIPRAYATIAEAPTLARELDPLCQVIVFTGRYPHALTVADGTYQSALQFIPHSGADLYATIVRVLKGGDCRWPRTSVDTIDTESLHEAFDDVGLEAPRHVIAPGVDGAEFGARTASDLVAFHRERYDAGEVDLCLTCVGSVFDALQEIGTPTLRIPHTASVVREALRKARLTEQLAITEATQPAAVLVSMSGILAGDDHRPYESQRRRLRAREAVIDIAERLHGRLADFDAETSMIYASRGMVELAIARISDGHDGPFSLRRLPPEARIGIGLGRTVADAEEHARQALAIGRRDGALHVGFPDGDVLRIAASGPATYRLRETHPGALRVAERLGIGPLALSRLTSALKSLDPSAVTASELARAYGIETRSARRLITSLQKAGIASRLGQQAGAGAGRPQTIYRIDIDKLAGSAEP
jgi:hypothetical protein